MQIVVELTSLAEKTQNMQSKTSCIAFLQLRAMARHPNACRLPGNNNIAKINPHNQNIYKKDMHKYHSKLVYQCRNIFIFS